MQVRPAFLAFLSVPAGMLIYTVAFLNSIGGLKDDSRRFPVLIISLLIPLLIFVVVSEFLQERRAARDSWMPLGREVTDGAEQSFGRQIVHKVLHQASIWSPSAATVVLLAVFLALIARAGFYTATVVYATAQSYLLKAGNIFKCAFIGAVVSIGCYLLFTVLLGFNVPSGALL